MAAARAAASAAAPVRPRVSAMKAAFASSARGFAGYERKRADPGAELEDPSRSHGLQFAKSLGQHILKNPLIIKGIVEKAAIKVCALRRRRESRRGELSKRLTCQALCAAD